MRRKLFISIIMLVMSHGNKTHCQVEAPKELLDQLQLLDKEPARVDVLNQLGLYYAPYDDSKALYYLQEAKSLAIQLDYQKGIANADYSSSRVYYYQDEYFIASRLLDQAKKTFEMIDDWDGLADVHFARGELEILFGDYVKAMNAYQQALQIEIKTGDQRGEAIVLNSLSGLHREQGNLVNAMDYALQSLEIRDAIQDSSGIGTIYTQLGCLYVFKDDLDSAEHYFKKGLAIREQAKDTRRISASKFHLGRLYNIMEQPSRALDYLNQSYALFKSMEEKTGMIIVRLEQGKSYNLLGNVAQSKKMVDDAHKLAQLTGNKNLIKDTYKDISGYYISTGDYKTGYEYLVQYKTIEDSLMHWRKSKLIDEMELAFQNQQKDIEIKRLQAENQIHRKNSIILWLSLGTILVLAFLVFYLYRVQVQKARQNKELLQKEQIIHQKDLQMQEKERLVLEHQLESKNRELGAKILSLLRNNEMQEKLVGRLSQLSKHIDKDQKALKELNVIIRELENQGAENLWDEFDKTFQSIHTEFYQRLLHKHPDLTPAEIKIATFLKLNLNTKEIAALTFKSESGIKSTRHRLRKKLNISTEDNLVNYLIKL